MSCIGLIFASHDWLPQPRINVYISEESVVWAELLDMFRLLLLVGLCALACSSIDAAKILAVYPTPSISHQIAFKPLTLELLKRGHEVVVITTDPVYPKGQTPENLTEIDVHDISYKLWNNLISTHKTGDRNSIVEQFEGFDSVTLKIFEKQTEFPEIRDIIENKNHTFDLLLVEAWTRYALGYSHAVKVPVIAISSFGAILGVHDMVGAPTHPLLYPQMLVTRYLNLTLWEKVKQYYTYFSLMNYHKKSEATENAALRRIFGEDIPPLSELQNNVDMLFLNIHPIWEGNRPMPPNVIHIGGIHQKPEKELPQDLKQYLDSSEHGVIYISFGTNVDTSVLPADKVQAIINVFSQLPYDVLWKWNEDELPGRTKNIRISKWLPQSDLLRHPKIKLFILQGGLQSTDETISAGVPVIGVGMLGDQWYNAEKYVQLKIGKRIDLGDLNEETLKSAIEEIIGDKSYRDNIVRLRTLMNDQPQSSLERAVWWTEHVLRHGGARHLRAPAANMGWAEYYDLELVLIVLSVALAVILLGSFVIYKVLLSIIASYSVKIKKS